MNLALDLPSPTTSDFSNSASNSGTSSNLDELRSVVDHRLNSIRPNRTPVLQQLRSQYPTGCLLSDLVQVNADQFIVRASVQVEGATIVTALASAATVEVAEDRARARALEALGLNLGHSAVSASLSATLPMIQELAPELTIPPIMQSAPEPTEKTIPRTATKRKAKAQSVEAISAAPALDLLTDSESLAIVEEVAVIEPVIEPVIAAVIEPKTAVIAESEPVAEIQSVVELELVSEIQAVAEPEAIVQVEAPEVIAEAVIAEPVISEPVAEPVIAEALTAPVVDVEESFEISYESEEVYEYTFEETVEAPIVEAPKAFVAPTPVAAIDLSDTIAQIGMEIDRIGWTKKQGSAYLQQEYSKRTRAELTEAELFSFLGYLKSLPAKLQPELSQIPF